MPSLRLQGATGLGSVSMDLEESEITWDQV